MTDNDRMEPGAASPARTTSDAADHTIMIREIDGEVVALDTRENLVHQLNATASLIWRLAVEGRAQEEIAAAIASEYAVNLATASKDVGKVTTRLKALNLLARE